MEVKDNQYVFWAADGATLTIGGETTMTGGLAATGTEEKTPLVSVNDNAKATVSNMILESAKVVPNSTKEFKVASLDSSESKIISTGSGAVTITESEGTVVVQNTGTGTVKIDENIIDVNKAEEIVDGQSTGTVSVTVAMIGTTEYTDIDDAISHGDGKTIKLVSDITDTSVESSANTSVTIDLNGKQVGTNDYPVAIIIGTNGEFYICNLSESIGIVYIKTQEVTPPSPDQLIIYGGRFNIDVSAYVAEGYIATAQGTDPETWKVIPDIPQVSVVKDGESESVIMSLAAFRNKVNVGNTYAGYTITLLDDIDLGDSTWTPIGKFSGTIDGNNHTISGIHIIVKGNGTIVTGNHKGIGFINYLYGGEVKDLNLVYSINEYGDDPNDKYTYFGGVAGAAAPDSAIVNCNVSGTIYAWGRTGGIVGWVPNPGTRLGQTDRPKNGSGDPGSIPENATYLLVKSCDFTGTINTRYSSTAETTERGSIGGLFGAVDNYNSSGVWYPFLAVDSCTVGKNGTTVLKQFDSNGIALENNLAIGKIAGQIGTTEGYVSGQDEGSYKTKWYVGAGTYGSPLCKYYLSGESLVTISEFVDVYHENVTVYGYTDHSSINSSATCWADVYDASTPTTETIINQSGSRRVKIYTTEDTVDFIHYRNWGNTIRM